MSRHGLTLREFIEHCRGQSLEPWQIEVLEAMDPENATHEEDPTMSTEPTEEQLRAFYEAKDRDEASHRTTRYVYHVHGHAKLHPWASDVVNGAPEQGPAVPFEVVLRQKDPITSDGAMDIVRQDVRGHIVSELDKQGSPYIVGDVMIRGLSLLHTILVEANDPEGPAVRVLS